MPVTLSPPDNAVCEECGQTAAWHRAGVASDPPCRGYFKPDPSASGGHPAYLGIPVFGSVADLEAAIRLEQAGGPVVRRQGRCG